MLNFLYKMSKILKILTALEIKRRFKGLTSLDMQRGVKYG